MVNAALAAPTLADGGLMEETSNSVKVVQVLAGKPLVSAGPSATPGTNRDACLGKREPLCKRAACWAPYAGTQRGTSCSIWADMWLVVIVSVSYASFCLLNMRSKAGKAT